MSTDPDQEPSDLGLLYIHVYVDLKCVILQKLMQSIWVCTNLMQISVFKIKISAIEVGFN